MREEIGSQGRTQGGKGAVPPRPVKGCVAPLELRAITLFKSQPEE